MKNPFIVSIVAAIALFVAALCIGMDFYQATATTFIMYAIGSLIVIAAYAINRIVNK